MYIAGFFDGEGCIGSSNDCYGNLHYVISIVQKPIKVLKLIRIFLLKRDIECSIYFQKTNKCYQLCVTSRINQAMFLNRILPFLIVKKDKAEEC